MDFLTILCQHWIELWRKLIEVYVEGVYRQCIGLVGECFVNLYHVALYECLEFHTTNNDHAFSEHICAGDSSMYVSTQTKHITRTCYSGTITNCTFLISGTITNCTFPIRTQSKSNQILLIERTAVNVRLFCSSHSLPWTEANAWFHPGNSKTLYDSLLRYSTLYMDIWNCSLLCCTWSYLNKVCIGRKRGYAVYDQKQV
jgi:hypothetical protein